jgi:putative ABC transport system permease protein
VTLRGALARAALFIYPRDFREHFGTEILADIDAGANTPEQLFDLLKGAVVMHLDTIARDIAYALRRLRSAPLFVAIVVLTFALGIGANVAVFSVLNAVVLKQLPFADPSSLVVLTSIGPRGDIFPAVSPRDAQDIAAHARDLSGIAASSFEQPTLLLGGKPYALGGLKVSSNYLTLLGVRPQLGRGFIPADGAPGVRSAIISDQLWHERFGADPSIVGRSISLDSNAYRVVGVLAPGQLLPDPQGGQVRGQDVLTALPADVPASQRGARMAGGIARLSPGMTLAQTNAELKLVSAELVREYPNDDKGWSFFVQSLSALTLGGVASSLWIVFGAVVAILLIACANVGNMLAARWSSRDRELAVRRALGASSSRIAAQLLIETAVLATLGACFGVALAYGALHGLAGLVAHALPRAGTIGIDGWSLLYALAIVIVATFLAGLSPLLSLRTADLQLVLKSAGRGGDSSRRHRLRAALVVLEVALAIALVTVSGLMLRSFLAVVNTPLGVNTSGVVASDAVALSTTDAFSPFAGNTSVQNDVLRRLQALPGVKSAALALDYPVGEMMLESPAEVFGQTYAHGQAPLAIFNAVTARYFDVFGVHPILGRTFGETDTANSAPVAMVSERFARVYLHGANPLRARIRIQTGPTQWHWAQIVGVVPDERDGVGADFDAASLLPEFYAPLAQLPQPFFSAVVRAPGLDPAIAGREVDSAFAAAMPLTPPPPTFTIAQRIANVTQEARLMTILLGSLAAIALLLALSGIFGVVSFSVTQRSREFGVRMALGASALGILADVLRRAIATTAIGVAIGIFVAALAAHAIVAQLGAISPLDPATFMTVVALIFVCAALAALQPALRATRVQPVESLRYE